MKLLLVAEKESLQIAKFIGELARKGNSEIEVEVTMSEKALAKFFEVEPSHVLIVSYTDTTAIHTTWHDLVASASAERILRTGWEPFKGADYLRMPFDGTRLNEFIGQ